MIRYRRLKTGGKTWLPNAQAVFSYDAVFDIEAQDGVDTRDSLLRMLQAGELMPSDLVLCDGRWMPFSEAPDFYEQCVGLADERVAWLQWRAVLCGLVNLGAVFVVVVLPLLRRF